MEDSSDVLWLCVTGAIHWPVDLPTESRIYSMYQEMDPESVGVYHKSWRKRCACVWRIHFLYCRYPLLNSVTFSNRSYLRKNRIVGFIVRFFIHFPSSEILFQITNPQFFVVVVASILSVLTPTYLFLHPAIFFYEIWMPLPTLWFCWIASPLSFFLLRFTRLISPVLTSYSITLLTSWICLDAWIRPYMYRSFIKSEAQMIPATLSTQSE